MSRKRLTLLSDGPTDQALLPLLRWLVLRHSTTAFEQNWADLRHLRRPPSKLPDRAAAALDLYPCEILVIHRDAERESAAKRREEIEGAASRLPIPVVAVVPVRMTEAWLLFDETAIRRASGCPNGSADLCLPRLKDVEAIPDPKEVLHQALKTASNLTGRKLKRFQPDIRRLADLIDDFTTLCALPSFMAAEESLMNALASLGLLRDSNDDFRSEIC